MSSSTHQALNALLEAVPPFVAQLERLAQRLQLSLADYQADHISLRCHQLATAEQWRAGLLSCGTLLSEQQINGRPICLFLLDQPLAVGPWLISCIELPYPGSRYYPLEGWEHVELILPVEPEQLHSAALALLPDAALQQSDIKLKFSQPGGELRGLPNPTLAVSDGQVTIKFHPYSIQQIVASEQGQ